MNIPTPSRDSAKEHTAKIEGAINRAESEIVELEKAAADDAGKQAAAAARAYTTGKPLPTLANNSARVASLRSAIAGLGADLEAAKAAEAEALRDDLQAAGRECADEIGPLAEECRALQSELAEVKAALKSLGNRGDAIRTWYSRRGFTAPNPPGCVPSDIRDI